MILYIPVTETFKFAYSCAHSEHRRMFAGMSNDCFTHGVFKYINISDWICQNMAIEISFIYLYRALLNTRFFFFIVIIYFVE